MPVLSIIIPVYNNENYIEDTVQSVLRQTYTDYELILVDDGSPDHSLELCQKLAAADFRIRIFHKENGGVSSARNFGLEQAKGKYIAFLDGDDCIDPPMYEWMIEVLEQERADIAGCCTIREKEYQPLQHDKGTFLCNTRPINFLDQEGYLMGSALNKVYRRELIGDTRFDETISYSEDNLFVAEILIKAKKIVLLPNPFYHYIQHQDSLSWRESYQQWEGYFRAKKKVYEIVRQVEADDNVRQSTFRGYVKAIIALLRYDVKDQQRQRYEETLRANKAILQQFLRETKMPLGKRLEYLTYTTSWGLADWVHYRLKRRK